MIVQVVLNIQWDLNRMSDGNTIFVMIGRNRLMTFKNILSFSTLRLRFNSVVFHYFVWIMDIFSPWIHMQSLVGVKSFFFFSPLFTWSDHIKCSSSLFWCSSLKMSKNVCVLNATPKSFLLLISLILFILFI